MTISLHQLRGDTLVSNDPALLDFDVIHAFLTQSYWSPGIPRALVERAAANSCPIGLYRRAGEQWQQIGYTRIVTDAATFGYIADVFVLDGYRGQGLARWMVDAAVTHPDWRDVRTWLLTTRDAHEVYRRVGFTEVDPGRFMRKAIPPDWLVPS